jgi:hypothetical protein
MVRRTDRTNHRYRLTTTRLGRSWSPGMRTNFDALVRIYLDVRIPWLNSVAQMDSTRLATADGASPAGR